MYKAWLHLALWLAVWEQKEAKSLCYTGVFLHSTEVGMAALAQLSGGAQHHLHPRLYKAEPLASAAGV